MQTVFSQRLLAGLRILRDEEEIRGNDTFQNPDDRVDPDEAGPRLSVTLGVAEIYALPEPLETELTSGALSRYWQSIQSTTIGARHSRTARFTRPCGAREAGSSPPA
jgi:hypothetical protein